MHHAVGRSGEFIQRDPRICQCIKHLGQRICVISGFGCQGFIAERDGAIGPNGRHRPA